MSATEVWMARYQARELRRATWIVAVIAGCGGNTGTDSDSGAGPVDTAPVVEVCTDRPLTVEVGTGELAFEALFDGAPVTMNHGPQGGWHVDVAGLVGNARQTVSVRPSLVVDATGEEIAGEQTEEFLALAAFDPEACTGQFWGRRAFLDNHPSTDLAFICSLEGEAATVSVEVVDPEDLRSVVGEVSVTLQLDPVDEDDCP